MDAGGATTFLLWESVIVQVPVLARLTVQSKILLLTSSKSNPTRIGIENLELARRDPGTQILRDSFSSSVIRASIGASRLAIS